MNRMFDVVTIGSATRDVFLRSKAWETHASEHSPTGAEACLPLGAKVPIDEINFATGGGATNAAVTFARLGKLRTATICRIGAKDAGGRTVLEDLQRERVDTRFVQRDPKLHTGYSIILLSGSGERTILSHRGASQALDAKRMPWTKLRARWYYLTATGGDLPLTQRILAHASRTGACVAWNPGGGEIAHGWGAISPLAQQCAVFNVNREEAAALTAKPFDDLDGILAVLRPTLPRPPSRREVGKRNSFSPSHGEGERAGVGRLVLVTDGSGGAYACDGQATWHIASRNLHAVNTTGAGDAFGSAFVVGLMQSSRLTIHDSRLDRALRLAMANAEGVITHMGAKAGILRKIPSRVVLAQYTIRKM